MLVSLSRLVLGLTLGLLTGGGVALGALTAPVVFRRFERRVAGAAMTQIFRRFDRLLFVGALAIIAAELLALTGGAPRGLSLVRSGSGLVLAGLGLYHATLLGAEIERRVLAEETGDAGFEALHRRSEASFKLATLAGAISLALLSLGY